jgi:methylated-DNA-[protein]-cysteine S-methyltransferase
LKYHELGSPAGPLRLVGTANALAAIQFLAGNRPAPLDPAWTADASPFADIARQLDEYFRGQRQVFDVELIPQGTPFQRAVWNALRTIPYGTSCSYGALARQIGAPRAVRAVGAANGANPWPIVVPCHRVIGSDRSLTGFGGGIAVKRLLLQLEAEAAADGRLV